MNPRRAGAGIASNPVLIGAATVLIVFVAVFLSYNANSGLPFVPTYELKLELPNAKNLVPGNEVRIGGTRVGAISKIEAKRQPDGSTRALLTTKLEQAVDPLPKDTTVLVRTKSALGLKYVELTPGRSRAGYASGDTVPMAQARPEPVDLDDVFNTFQRDVRAAGREGLTEFGTALGGRGEDLNLTLAELPALLRDLTPVMRNLRAPDTGLTRFVRELADAARIVAPAAETQAALFRDLDTTMGALDSVRGDVQESITSGRPTLDQAARTLPAVRPFLGNTARLFADLRPGVRALRGSAPTLTAALVTGTRTLRRTPPFNRRLADLLEDVADFGQDPLVPRGIRKLRETVTTLRPTLDFVAPAQTRCNYAALWFRNVASLLSEGDANGTWQRFIIVAVPTGPNAEGGPSSGPADGPMANNHYHANPYPNTGAPGQDVECEAANESYDVGKTTIGNDPGDNGTKVDGNP